MSRPNVTPFLWMGALAAGLAAQGSPPNPNNENDLLLSHGPEVAYTYNDPSPGPPVGTATAAAYFAANDFIWKVYPREVMRSCSGTLEVSGLKLFLVDSDSMVFDASGNNTILPDIAITTGVDGGVGGSGSHPGLIEPDPSHIIVEISFGEGGPGKNNAALPQSSCSPELWGQGVWEVDVALGTGAGDGVLLAPADGSTDFVITSFIPGGQTANGPGTCSPEHGDYVTPDLRSADKETMFDVLGTGYSPYGGWGSAGVIDGADGVREISGVALQFFEPILNARFDSGTGSGPEMGTNGLHLDASNGQASIGARLFAWQGIGRPAAVTASLSPLAPCVNFAGGALGIASGDPLFPLLLGLWHSPPPIVQTEDGDFPAMGTVYDDGTFTTSNLSIGQVPPGLAIPIHLQGFYRKLPGGLQSTQVWTAWIHG